METIFTVQNEALLNTNLSEEAFAKTKFSTFLNETGIKVSKDQNDCFSIFEEWKFTGTKTIDKSVYFTSDEVNGKNLTQINQSEDNGRNLKQILFNIIQAYTNAIIQKVALPALSPAGIIIDENTLWFAPEKLFNAAVKNQGKEYFETVQEPWFNPELNGTNRLYFTRAVYTYFALTKELPYPISHEEEKTINIAFKNFIPLEISINRIQPELTLEIDEALALSSKSKQLDMQFSEQELKTALFAPETLKPNFPEEIFGELKSLFLKRIIQKNKLRKFINKWKFAFSIGIVLAAIAAFFAIVIVVENGKRPSVRGLTSTEVTEVFYSGLHTMHTNYLEAASKNCPEAQFYINRVPQVYVSTQMRSAYNFESGISTPENWMFFEPDSTKAYSHTIFGLTDFYLDGKPVYQNRKPPKVNQKKSRLIKENGERLYNSSKTTHKVSYNLLQSAEDKINLDHFEATVHLNYIKDRWQITKIDEIYTSQQVPLLELSLDLKEALKKSNDEITGVNSLRSKYNWLPTEEALIAEKKRLDSIGY